jgi:hypothetical protein
VQVEFGSRGPGMSISREATNVGRIFAGAVPYKCLTGVPIVGNLLLAPDIRGGRDVRIRPRVEGTEVHRFIRL